MNRKNKSSKHVHKVLLIIRDGWGEGKKSKGNAISLANVPNHRYYTKNYPTTVLECTGNAVGNPDGVQGGSEVGHLTMGAGRIVWQPYELINQEIKSGNFFKNKELIKAIEHCKKNSSSLHLCGLFSTEGVHADRKHMYAILELCKKMKFSRVLIHLCLDGRDMPERSALPVVKEMNAVLKRLGVGKVASVFGRYYGMDRDTNWDRTKEAFDAMVNGLGFTAKDASEAIQRAYERGDKTDYYVQPTVIMGKDNNPVSTIQDGDSFIWYSFRSDRSRQITAMLTGQSYCPMKVDFPKVHYVCMCKYDDSFNLPVAFPQTEIKNNLGSVLSGSGISQLRIAETEKYAHVTFFFNSQVTEPYKGEERVMINSPKVASYDLKPEMSAYGVKDAVLAGIEKEKYGFIAVNFANADLVGHSGVLAAAVKACEVVDECVGEIVKKAIEKGYVVFLTADHGNADHMLYDDGAPDPSHGFDPVTFTLISDDEKLKKAKLNKGKGLKDIAPTALEILGIKKPKEMTGESLVVK